MWNGWYVENTFDAFSRAADQNKPMVLVVSESWCEHCVRLVRDSLRCPSIDRFAGGAVFAIGSPSRDRVVSAIATSLKIEKYPTIVVLEPDVRMLLERGSVNGYFPSSTLGEHLETLLWKTKPEDYISEDGVAEPLPPQKPFAGQNPLTYWTSPPDSAQSIAAARSGATQRGLKHAAPAPKCE